MIYKEILLTVLFVSREQLLVSLKTRPRIEMVSFGDQRLPNIFLPIHNHTLELSKLKIDHFTILEPQSAECLVRNLVASKKM